MNREERSAQAAGIAGYCFLFGCGGIVLIVALAQLFGKFRHVGPEAMQWVNAHGDALGELVRGFLA